MRQESGRSLHALCRTTRNGIFSVVNFVLLSEVVKQRVAEEGQGRSLVLFLPVHIFSFLFFSSTQIQKQNLSEVARVKVIEGIC